MAVLPAVLPFPLSGPPPTVGTPGILTIAADPRTYHTATDSRTLFIPGRET